MNKIINRVMLAIFIFTIILLGNKNIAHAENINLHVWVSEDKMGDSPKDGKTLYNNHYYYLCYELIGEDNKRIGSRYNYSVTEKIYLPSGKLGHSHTYKDSSDNNWIGLSSSETGTYRGTVEVKGDVGIKCDVDWYVVDGTPVVKSSLNNISLDTVSSPTKNLKVTVSGDIDYTYHLNYAISNKDVVSATWGGWSGNKMPLTLRAKAAGEAKMTINLCKSSDNSVVATTYISVKVKASKKETYTVSYNANGGSGAPASQKKKEDEPLTLSSTEPVKSYTIKYDSDGGPGVSSKNIYAPFKNWNVKSNGSGKAYNKGAVYTENEDVTLYAQYDKALITDIYIPYLTRDGYSFEGWYTSKNGGTHIYVGTSINSSLTLYARWKKEAEPDKKTYTVTYNANGGSGAPTSQIKVEDEALTLSSIEPVKYYTINYDCNGGSSISPKSLQAPFKNWNSNSSGTGKIYEKGSAYTDNANITLFAQYGSATITNTHLPNLTRDGYRFSGWYTSKTGGTLLQAGASITNSVTFYARWEKDADPEPDSPEAVDLGDLYYSFINSRSDLGYSSGYKIPLSVFQRLFDSAQAQMLYSRYGTWEGSCFGFSTSSILMNTNYSDMKPSKFNKGAMKVSTLKRSDYSSDYSMDVRTMLEIMQISQFKPEIQRQFSDRGTNGVSAELKNMINDLKEKGSPVCIGVSRTGIGGHAIVGYAVETGSSYDQLLVYDCNFGNKKRAIKLGKNSKGDYVSWEYNVNDYYPMGTNYSGSYIDWVDTSTFQNIWNSRTKSINADCYSLVSVKIDSGATLYIYDSQNQLVGTINNKDLASKNTEVFKLRTFDTIVGDDTLFYVPDGSYKMVPDKKSGMEIIFSSPTKTARVKLTTDEPVYISVTDEDINNSLEFDPVKDTYYDVELISDDSMDDIYLNGTSDGTTVVVTQGDNLTTEEQTEKPDNEVIPEKGSENNNEEKQEETAIKEDKEVEMPVDDLTDSNNTSISKTIKDTTVVDENIIKPVIKSIKYKKNRKYAVIKIEKQKADSVEIRINSKKKTFKSSNIKIKLKRGKNKIKIRTYKKDSKGAYVYSQWVKKTLKR